MWSAVRHPVDLPDGSAARRWGDGPYGLVLVHDQGLDLRLLGLPGGHLGRQGHDRGGGEVGDAGATLSALRSLLEDGGLDRVALLRAPVTAPG